MVRKIESHIEVIAALGLAILSLVLSSQAQAQHRFSAKLLDNHTGETELVVKLEDQNNEAIWVQAYQYGWDDLLEIAFVTSGKNTSVIGLNTSEGAVFATIDHKGDLLSFNKLQAPDPGNKITLRDGDLMVGNQQIVFVGDIGNCNHHRTLTGAISERGQVLWCKASNEMCPKHQKSGKKVWPSASNNNEFVVLETALHASYPWNVSNFNRASLLHYEGETLMAKIELDVESWMALSESLHNKGVLTAETTDAPFGNEATDDNWFSKNQTTVKKHASLFELVEEGAQGNSEPKIELNKVMQTASRESQYSYHEKTVDIRAVIIDPSAVKSRVVQTENEATGTHWVVELYPKPAANYVNVLSNQTITNWRVLSSTGRVLMDGDGLPSSINTANLNAGCYILELLSENAYKRVEFVKL